MFSCKLVDDTDGFIVRCAINDDHLELFPWIVKLENVFELLANHCSLVVCRNDQGDGWDNLTNHSGLSAWRTPTQKCEAKSIRYDNDANRRVIECFQCGYRKS